MQKSLGGGPGAVVAPWRSQAVRLAFGPSLPVWQVLMLSPSCQAGTQGLNDPRFPMTSPPV